ncbi:MAG: hypothetical protein A2632_03260 [Candidatus Pacebacteria bacterium RIFCSPHIGHO2_01_FULL_46_16]|nr:MAG: hypothetical protein A2632_03260 [Candidatus Pacebacteria bacterium RIFCSPHIGHO2_01_FULL_46_16]OGJ39438.1 MAG: hypothetical protein A3A82_00040 [Candidatus Pacebacteria bacterium RIFCSPLOWO2_01_FULL_47_12]
MSHSATGVLLSIVIFLTVTGLWFLKTLPTNTPQQPIDNNTQNAETKPILGATTTQASDSALPNADKLYGLINGYRRDHRLTPLTAHTALERSARQKLADMVAKKYWRHGDTDNSPPWRFFGQAGYQYARAGENLAFGVTSSWQTFSGWQASQTHNEQLLEPEYQDMGIAVECDYYAVYADQTCLVVLHLAQPR